jgi:signal transduction histidine kinase/ligand-binding sensor domain-containing protein/DNA-binding response OmpR family regulator
MKRIPQFLICIAFLFLFQGLSPAQNLPEYKFHTLSPEGGLGYDGVLAIKQDRYGFVWILMRNELFRFDGYNYKRYSDQLKGVDSYSSNLNLNDIEEDKSGRIYIASENGLFVLNRITEKFKRMIVGSIGKIKEDNSENLWVVNNQGICLFNEEKQVINLIEPNKVTGQNTPTAFCSVNGMFIVAKDSGMLYELVRNRMEFKLISKLPVKDNVVDIIKIDHALWILTEYNGLWVVNLQTKKIERKIDLFYKKGYKQIQARKILLDKYKNLWIATQKGLYLFNPVTGGYSLFTHSDLDSYSLYNNSINFLQLDHQGNMWIGTFSGGVCYLDFNETSRFKTIQIQSEKQGHNIISAFAENGNDIWIGSEGGGLIRYNKVTSALTSIIHNSNGNSLAYDNVKALLLDNNKFLWIGMFQGGLDCLNLETGKFKNFSDKDPDRRIIVNHIYRLEAEADSGIWIGYLNVGLRLTYFSKNGNLSEHYLFNVKGSPQIVGTYIADFVRDNENNLWIATRERLNVMNVKTHIMRIIPIDTISGHDLPNMNIQTLFWNKQDQTIWIGTTNSGLIKYNKKTGQFNYFRDILNYNVHSIYSINADNQNNLWLGTDNGLFKFDTNLKQFFQFGKEDGLQGHLYYPRASFKSKTGELFFGGTEGFSIVDPQQVKTDFSKTQIIFSDFFINNLAITPNVEGSSLKESICSSSEIRLNYAQSNFGFEFSSTNFLTPNKTRFKYRLKGYDDHWTEVDATRRYVYFAKVPSGHYTFEVLATNVDGVWSNTPKIIKINVQPAPWYSWWAYMLYTMLIGTIIYFIRYYLNEQRRLKMELVWEANEKKIQEENNEAKLQFFTNISHEFKTPLSLIIASLERLKQEAIPVSEKYFTIMGNNSKRLLNLINELMDFRTIEKGKMYLKVSSGNLNEFVEGEVSDFKEYALQRNINFNVKMDLDLNIPVFFDRQIVEKVIMNLLNNAFKYTANGGSIEIETLSDLSALKSNHHHHYRVMGNEAISPMFAIVVRDSGIGISEQSISKVFDRFYMVNDPKGQSHLGSGIGLALVKSLVMLHKGHISIYSEREKGTDMVVAFPQTKRIYEPSQLIETGDFETPFVETKNYFDDIVTSTMTNDLVDELETFFHGNRKRVLLAEDNDDLRSLIAESLTKQYEVFEASDGEIATQLLKKKDFDLIISDIMMPEKDGVTFCKEVKEDIVSSHIPFIMMTAKGGLESKMEGIGSGADAYLEKPINFKLLHLTMLNLFKQQNRIKEFYAKNFYSETSENAANHLDNDFMKQLVDLIEANIDQSNLDINYLTTELAMSRSKLYAKVKSLTDKSIVDFIRYYRLRKAVKLLVEDNLAIQDVMIKVGIESQSYFTRAFKKEFGENPSTFVANARRKLK